MHPGPPPPTQLQLLHSRGIKHRSRLSSGIRRKIQFSLLQAPTTRLLCGIWLSSRMTTRPVWANLSPDKTKCRLSCFLCTRVKKTSKKSIGILRFPVRSSARHPMDSISSRPSRYRSLHTLSIFRAYIVLLLLSHITRVGFQSIALLQQTMSDYPSLLNAFGQHDVYVLQVFETLAG